MIVHQLVQHRLAEKGSGWTIVAVCSATTARRSGDVFPADFTIWASQVTCPECKGTA